MFNAKSQSFYLSIEEDIPFSYRSHFRDSAKVVNELENLVVRLRQKGYLLANTDSIYFQNDTLYVVLYKGEQYKWANVNTEEIQYILQKTGYTSAFSSFRKITYRQFLKIEKHVLSYANNHGYPFAHLFFEPTKINKQTIEGIWHYDSHTLFTFDSLIIENYTGVQSKYLQRVLGFQKGEIYKKKKINEISKNLQKLGFVEETKKMEISFQKNVFRIILHLKKRKQHEFNGLIGFLPQEEQQLQVTGDVKIHLVNLFRRGIQTHIDWKKPDQYSQQLDLLYEHPFILNTILYPSFLLNIQKQDTTFLTVQRGGKLSFFPSLTNQIDFGISHKTSQNIQERKDSLYQDFSKTSYSFAYQYQQLDNYWFPKKGYYFYGNLSIGEKKLEDVNLEGVENKTWQWQWFLNYQCYSKLYKKIFLFTEIKYEGVQNVENQLWENDLFQFGGFQSLRGFNENELKASQWTILTIEPRFWFDETSFLYLFFDQSYHYYYQEQWAQGVGIGIQLQVKNGIFNFATALGRSSILNEVNLNLFKVHFGLVTKF